MTGATFIRISATAATIWDVAVLSLMDESWFSKLWLMLRTWVCDVARESMYACCALVAPFLYRP